MCGRGVLLQLLCEFQVNSVMRHQNKQTEQSLVALKIYESKSMCFLHCYLPCFN